MKRFLKTSLALSLVVAMLTACGKKIELGLTEEEINSYEHIFSNVPSENVTVKNEYDKDGYLITDDTVYISTETSIIRSLPSEEGETLGNVGYGTALKRYSITDSGYCKVEYNDQEAYVALKNVTSLKIDLEKNFNYTLSALNIVDTNRQFYTYEDMCEDFKLIKQQFSDVVSVNAIGVSTDNRTIFDIVIGNPKAEKQILIVGGEIGREYMTSMVLAKYIEYYAHYAGDGLYNGYSYKELLNNCGIHIVPMLNPDGIAISQFFLDGVTTKTYYDNINQWFERDQTNGGTSLSLDNYLMFYDSNIRGCDINKNFPYNWEETSSNTYPGSKNYKGDLEGSENETKAILKLIDMVKPSLVINFKTTGSDYIYNFGQEEEVLNISKKFATSLAGLASYSLDEEAHVEDSYGSLEGYVSNICNIPAIRINVGNGEAPLSLNEYYSIWNSQREVLAQAMVMLINN